MTASGIAAAVTFVLLGTGFESALAREGAQIIDLKAEGDCSLGDVRISATQDDGDRLVAMFESLAARAKDDGHDKEACTLRYTLKLPTDRRLSTLSFTTDSRYRLADEGEVRITVKHRVGSGRSFGTTVFRARDDDDPAQGMIAGTTAQLRFEDLSLKHQSPGAEIPMMTKIIVSAITDESGESAITALRGISTVILQPDTTRQNESDSAFWK